MGGGTDGCDFRFFFFSPGVAKEIVRWLLKDGGFERLRDILRAIFSGGFSKNVFFLLKDVTFSGFSTNQNGA